MVRLVLGTMTFAKQTGEAAAGEMLRLLGEGSEDVELDTARLYESGASEAMLGRLLAAGNLAGKKVVVATKINAWEKGSSLAAHSCKQQVDGALRAMQAESVQILYLHGPDKKTPIEETLAVLQKLHEAGKFRELGLSNFSAKDVAYIHAYMSEREWVCPSVYQGVYNYLTRVVEAELLPALRALGIRFYAFNPLAGGLLTGKYTFEQPAVEGRFVERKNYKAWYWKQPFFSALQPVQEACAQSGISPTEAALRWLIHHSALSEEHGDSIILGASTVPQLEENLRAGRVGPLPEAVKLAVESGWSLTEKESRNYHWGDCLKKG